jgi:hypothetical protein
MHAGDGHSGLSLGTRHGFWGTVLTEFRMFPRKTEGLWPEYDTWELENAKSAIRRFRRKNKPHHREREMPNVFPLPVDQQTGRNGAATGKQ